MTQQIQLSRSSLNDTSGTNWDENLDPLFGGALQADNFPAQERDRSLATETEDLLLMSSPDVSADGDHAIVPHSSTPIVTHIQKRATQAEIENRKKWKSTLAVLSTDIEKLTSKVNSLKNKFTSLETKIDLTNNLLKTVVELLHTTAAPGFSLGKKRTTSFGLFVISRCLL